MSIFDILDLIGGLALFLFGMHIMGDALEKAAGSRLKNILAGMTGSPLRALLLGLGVTAVIQSSSATTVMVVGFVNSGLMELRQAIGVIMGANIGTTVTALLSSVGTTRAARRAALVHFYFNLIGTVVCLPVFWLIRNLAAPALLGESATAFSIAVFHSVFNVTCTALLFPFRGKLEALAIRTIPETAQDAPFAMLDERLLTTPAIAAERCRTLICDMASRAERNLLLAISLLVEPSDTAFETVETEESYLDRCEDALGSYLVKLSAASPSEADSRSVSQWLHTVTDLERIGDHAMNIAQHARDMAQSGHSFSPAAQADLQVITDALTETVTRATQAFRDGDIPAAQRVEPLEDVIDSLSAQLRDRHVKRLQAGQCEFANSFAFDEILTDLERVGDHCSNIAACEIALSAANMDMHAYRDAVKAGETGDFRSERKAAAAKYRLPPL